jgi:hypothetical protein
MATVSTASTAWWKRPARARSGGKDPRRSASPLAQEEMRAYLESAKAKAKIKIAPSALEPKAE